jgi:DNA-directed RNA polymerase specialized sigma24 family protein
MSMLKDMYDGEWPMGYQDQEDFMQDALLAIHLKGGLDCTVGYVEQKAKWLSIDAHRRSLRLPDESVLQFFYMPQVEEPIEQANIDKRISGLFKALYSGSLSKTLEQTLATLITFPEGDVRFWSEKIGISEGAFHTRLSRLRNALLYIR